MEFRNRLPKKKGNMWKSDENKTREMLVPLQETSKEPGGSTFAWMERKRNTATISTCILTKN